MATGQTDMEAATMTGQKDTIGNAAAAVSGAAIAPPANLGRGLATGMPLPLSLSLSIYPTLRCELSCIHQQSW